MPLSNRWRKPKDERKQQPGQLPTSSGSGLDTNPQAVANILAAWLYTTSWDETRAVMEREQALLLTNTAEQILSEYIKETQQSKASGWEQQVNYYLMLHLRLLCAARAQGISAAWAVFETTLPLLEQDLSSTEGEQRTNPVPPDSNVLNKLATYGWRRYHATGQPEELNRALECWQEALVLTPSDSPNHPGCLNNLGTGLLTRYERTGALSDLERAIIAFEQAVDTTPPDSPARPSCLNNLGIGLSMGYERTGALPDLERAIAAFQQAVDTTPPDSPARPSCLNNLGNGLRIRYEHTGALSDLERAIIAFEQAVDTTPPDSPARPSCLNNLGNGLRIRYEHTGALPDLERAIAAFQQAVDTTPPNSPSRPGYLNNLGNGLRIRYEHTGALSDLERAIAALQQAVDTTPPNSPGRPGCLNNLGTGLSARYKRTGALPDLERAIAAFQQAVDTTPPDSSNRSGCLNNLGNELRICYEHTGALSDLERAIAASQQAVDTTPADSPNRPGRLNDLGTGLRDRYERTGTLPDLERAIAAWEESRSLLHSRFAVLPVVYQLGQQRQGVNIAANLVAAYLGRAARHPPGAQLDYCRALEVVEGSKSRLLTQLVGRGPLPLLPGLSPTIAAREQQLLADLIALDTRELATHNRLVPVQEEARLLERLQRRQELWHELQQLWNEIAKMGPAGADYVALRRGDTPTWNDIARLVEDLGPATALLSLFTAADQVCLFILRAGLPAPLVVEAALNDVGWDDLFGRFVREVVSYDPRRPLSETWEGPLRLLLAQAKVHLEGIERLILVPEGYGHLLSWSVLAEHAGWHTPLGQPLPLVVLPALGVLPRLRQRPHVRTGSALVVGNPTGNLPYAEVEASTVASLFGIKPLLGAAATKATVLAHLAQASLIHLATHAFFNPRDPLEAGIILADGDILTAREVLEHRLHADLLVLSACESGLTRSLGGEELAGLSQAFFQAGARSLLVSLWPVNDPATAALMGTFYTVWQAGADKAQALRQAMTLIQQTPCWMHPYYWGAFVLLGDWD